ncbi:hypothetical protein ACTHAM_000891 [Cellulomonas soli]|uniref:hypothetical protein n=1 Tax=Cellulomonas soli TaxID=931535 RepID=UPI003F857DF8
MTAHPVAGRLLGAATLTLVLVTGLSGCGPRDAPATPATTSSPTTASVTTSPATAPALGARSEEDALDALGSALTEATAAAELVEQEMAQDEEG